MEHIIKTWDIAGCKLAFDKARLLDTTLTMEKFTVYLIIQLHVKPEIVSAWVLTQRRVIKGDTDQYGNEHTKDYPHPEKTYPFTKE